jgi:hypothetical protein
MLGGQLAPRQASTSSMQLAMTQLISPHVVNCSIAQATNWSMRNWTSGHAIETHVPMHETLIRGGSAMKSRQPKMQVSTSPQVIVRQVPQSAGQLVQDSKPSSRSQRMLPQNEHTPQSVRQLEQVSVPAHRPSPQPMHMPQSLGQVKQLSLVMLQRPSPQVAQAPQSSGQVTQSSPRSG